MSLFKSAQEALEVGADLVRLHRAALGRNPDRAGLAGLLAARRAGTTLPELARILMETPEYERRARELGELGLPSSAAFATRIAAQALEGSGPMTAALAATLSGLSPEEVVVGAATAAPVKLRSAPFPALFPDVPPDDFVAYAVWVQAYDKPQAATLARLASPSGPRFSLLMLTGDTDAERAVRTVESLRAQAYPDWELCLARRVHSRWPRDVLDRIAVEERRVRLLDSPAGEPRADALNRALDTATGGFAGPLDPGDLLHPAALFEIASALAAHPATLLWFTDEDQADAGGERSQPWFKPDYSPDAMLAGNALGRLVLFETNLLNRLGGFRSAAVPFEEYELVLRAAAAAGAAHVRHIPAILCHRAEPPRDWPTPAASLDRGIAGVEVAAGSAWPRVRPLLPDPQPLVSVIVPTKDRAELLAACTNGLLGGTDYPAVELLVIDNGSTEPSALALLNELAGDPRVRVICWPGPFNFSAMNNAGARAAQGSILVMLNNDIEVHDPAWLSELVGHAARPDVGLVGARLLYPDGTLQHGGMALGPEGRATHVLRGATPDDLGYGGQLACARDVSAVTGACAAIRRDVWSQIGGMNEDLPVAWNDVDLCQRVRAQGLRIVWTPFATLLHREAGTRGSDAADQARQARFLADQSRYRSIWGDAADEDPFLNPNLVATDHALCLTVPRRPAAWLAAAARG